MRSFSGFLVLVCAGALIAQTNDPDVTRARASIEKLRGLVEAGAAPRVQLQKAEETLVDAEDAAYLRKTLYGQDLNEAQADDMIAAATRRFDRRKKAFDEGKKLVDQGVASAVSLATFVDELDMSRKECDLAESRAKLVREMGQMARTEQAFEMSAVPALPDSHAVAERFDGDGVFTAGMFSRLESAFEGQFGKRLPVSAAGETAVHRAMGFDHRGRVDVAIHPDQPEGIWLRRYLTANHIPYFAFRQAVRGKATGAHIHLGPSSTRLATGG